MVFNHPIGVRFPVGPPELKMPYFVYLISSAKNSKLTTYVRYTNNLKKRINLHNEGKGAKFTRGRKWKLLYKEEFSTKKDAITRENYIKKNRIFRNLIKEKFE